MAGCEGICNGLPGVAQPTVCQEVNENMLFNILSNINYIICIKLSMATW